MVSTAIVAGLAGAARADNAAHPQPALAGFSAREAVGPADWRGEAFDGRSTATGERFDMYRLTAASADLPLNSFAEVTNLATGETVIVRIIDRAPAASGRVITLSYAAAHRLGVDVPAPAQVRVSPTGAQPRVTRAATDPGDGALRPTLARFSARLMGEVLEGERREGLRGLLRGPQRRALMVTWADEAPTPLAGL